MALRIEVAGRHHRGLMAAFQNQHASLVEYLQRYALRHAEKDLLARTYLAIDDGDGAEGPFLAGYFSLAAVSVERALLGQVPELDRLPRFPIPGLLLARFAVDSRNQGQGLGRYLFDEVVGLSLSVARSGPVAIRLLVTDAIDPQAERFYERFGLVKVTDGHPCRMILDLRPLLEPPSP